jgi:DegV family protein with EDD domain
MAGIRIVTDSTADIPDDSRRAAGIEMVPLSILFGEESLLDKVEIGHEEFVRRLKASGKDLPTTAQPPIGLFEETYRRLADEGADTIVSLHLSERLSGTAGSARLAAAEVAGRVRVEVIDSRSITLGLGFLALEAARVAARGGDVAEIVATVQRMIPNIHIIFFPDTLEYLQKGGRIGRAAAIAGSILSLKPLMRLDEGVVVPHERTRTRSKAIDGLVKFARDFPHIRQLGALQIGDADIATLLDRLGGVYPRDRIVVTEVSPVIAVHLGPGTLGVVVDANEGSMSPGLA